MMTLYFTIVVLVVVTVTSSQLSPSQDQIISEDGSGEVDEGRGILLLGEDNEFIELQSGVILRGIPRDTEVHEKEQEETIPHGVILRGIPRDSEVRETLQDTTIPHGAATLAFVFDVTGSMYDDLVQVIEGAAKILATTLARRDKPLYNYVLVPFQDPGRFTKLSVICFTDFKS